MLVGVACGTSQKASTGAATPPPTAPPGDGPAHAANEAAAPRNIVVRWEARTEGQVLVVENHGDTTVDLATDVMGEEGKALSLRDDCDHSPPDCRPLAPGAALTPPPWNGGQCNGARPSAAPGPRVTVATCDGAHRFHSAP